MGCDQIAPGELQSERRRYRGGFVASLISGLAIIPHLMSRAEGGQQSLSVHQWRNFKITPPKWKQSTEKVNLKGYIPKGRRVITAFFPTKKSLAKCCVRTTKAADEAPICSVGLT